MFNVASKVRCTTLEGISSFSLRGTLKVSVREGLELEAGMSFNCGLQPDGALFRLYAGFG